MPTGPRRRYAVIGVGAIGGFYGGRLVAAGHEVHLVARSDAGVLATDGLRIDSVDGDVHLAPDRFAVHRTTATVPPVDVVLLAVKTTVAAADVAALVAPLARPGTVIVALQNGLGVEAPIAAAAPGCPVLGGLCFVCTNKVGPGHVAHLDFGAVTLGEHTADGAPAGVTDAVDAVAADLEGAGIKGHRVPDLVLGRWRKLVWNIPYNGLSVVLDAGTDELMADPATQALLRDLMGEVVACAGACGYQIPISFVDEMLTATAAMTPYRTSMKLDADARRPLELDAIYAAPIAAAAAAGHPMARTEALHRQLRFIDRRNRPVAPS